jgi:hypothetical protein
MAMPFAKATGLTLDLVAFWPRSNRYSAGQGWQGRD